MIKHSLTTKTLFTLLTQPGRHRPQRQHRFHKPARFNSDGIALPAAMFMVLAIIVASLVMTTRSLGSWSRSNDRNDAEAAQEAAEFGYTKIISQLNHDDKAYLLVTKFDNWDSVSSGDLKSCEIFASQSPSGITKTASVSSTQTYTLTNYTAPGFATGTAATNNHPSICDSSTSAAKFGNLLGGSAKVTVTGQVTRNGKVTATYVLNRSVHIKFPNQAISNPLVLLGPGSELKSLNGRICQTTTLPGSSTITSSFYCGSVTPKLIPTVISCADLENCLYKNVSLANNEYTGNRSRNKYCKNDTTSVPTRKYKKNIPCNTFQQLGEMPNFPKLGLANYPGQTYDGQPVYTDPRPTKYISGSGMRQSNQEVVSIELECVDYIYPYPDDDDDDYKGCTAHRYYYNSSNILIRKDSDKQDFSNFPYITSLSDTDFDKITDKAGLSNLLRPSGKNKLNDGCYPDTGSIQTATAINCVFGNFTDSTPDRASFKTFKADLKVWHTDIIPVNIWILGRNDGSTPALDLDNASSGKQGGIYNADESPDGWRNLKIFGYNSSSNSSTNNIPNGTNNCDFQTAKIGKSGRSRSSRKSDTEGVIDGAFMWFPNAKIEIRELNARTTPYLVMWACELKGPGSGSSAIFTPLSRLGVNAGISGVFNISGGSMGLNSYRAYGSKETMSQNN